MAKEEQSIIQTVLNYRREADDAKTDRMSKNKANFDMYHLRQDYSHKLEGQSREILPKQKMAVEQAANFIQQGLADLGDWYRVLTQDGLRPEQMIIKPESVRRIQDHMLDKINFFNLTGDAVKSGLLGSLIILKVHGKYCPKPKFEVKETLIGNKFKQTLVRKEDKAWELQIDIVRQENFYPDPSGKGLYFVEDSWLDFHEVEALSKGPDAIFDAEAVAQLEGSSSDMGTEEQHNQARETGQNVTNSGFRKRVKITECWGSLIDEKGKLTHENIVCTIANDTVLIRKPEPNPFWHKEHPYVFAPLLSVANSVWGTALMDAPTQLNIAQNELFNLIIDGGMMSVHGIKQIRESWLDDASQVEDGIPPGITLRANSSCPPGAKVLERIDTATVPQDGLAVLNLLAQEFNVSALTNDLRQGVQSFRAVKATEVVEASQSITSMFTGFAKALEEKVISKLLDKSWKVIAQHYKQTDKKAMQAVLGQRQFKVLDSLSNEKIFAETVQQCSFEVFGISETLNKQRDFTKLQALLQTVASSDILLEAFVRKYDLSKLLEEIIRSLDVNPAKIIADEEAELDLATQAPEGIQEQAQEQSQIPQAGAAINQVGEGSSIPRTEFPAGPASGGAQ